MFWNGAPSRRRSSRRPSRRCTGSVLPDSPGRAVVGVGRLGAVRSSAATRRRAAIRDAGAFGEPGRWRFDRERTYTRDEWLDQVPTTGIHTGSRRDVPDRVLAGVGEAVDAAGGAFMMPYTTLVVTAERAPTP